MPVRDTRVIYVENDAALRGIVARALAQADGLELLLATSSPHEALEGNLIEQADAALVDLALGLDVPNGIDLGIAMRERNPNIGIVVYSQYSLRNVARRVPENLRMGWAFMSKSGDMRFDDLVDVLSETVAECAFSKVGFLVDAHGSAVAGGDGPGAEARGERGGGAAAGDVAVETRSR